MSKIETKVRFAPDSFILEHFKEIDWNPLVQYIRDNFGIEEAPTINTNPYTNRPSEYLQIVWETDIKDKLGILSCILDSAHLALFSYDVVEKVSYNAEKVENYKKNNNYFFTDEQIDTTIISQWIYLSIKIKITEHKGGKNFINLFSAVYYFDKNEWKFIKGE